MDVKGATLILLAGGQSSRMGFPKGLLEHHGKAWLEFQLAKARQRGIAEAVIVLGYQAEEYFTALEWMEPARHEARDLDGVSVRVVLNDRPELGPFTTIQAGARALSADRPAFVLPIDVPCPLAQVWTGLAAALRPEIEACVPEWEGKGGHPVLLAPTFLARLRQLDPVLPVARLDMQLHELPLQRLARVSVSDPSIRMNFNNVQEWESYVSRA